MTDKISQINLEDEMKKYDLDVEEINNRKQLSIYTTTD